jgi:AcrR family transcriptional regulator
MTSPRDELTRRLVMEVAIHGLGDRSLRDLAAAVGTSHRMLLYHFGSRDGMVTAVVEMVEADQRAVLADLAAISVGPADLIRRLWHRVSAPDTLPFVRLFFETVAHRGAADLTAPWIEDSAPITEAFGVPFDPAEIRLGVAVTRGLLVDVILTGDADSATASLERFITMWEQATRPV